MVSNSNPERGPSSHAEQSRTGAKWLWGAWAILCLSIFVWMWLRSSKERADQVSVPASSDTVGETNLRDHVAAEQTQGKRAQAQIQAVETNSATAQFAAQLLDPSLAPKTRRQAARALAKIGSAEALSALKTGLREGPAYLKALIAESLGENPHPEARTMLLDLISSADEATARGA